MRKVELVDAEARRPTGASADHLPRALVAAVKTTEGRGGAAVWPGTGSFSAGKRMPCIGVVPTDPKPTK